MPAMQPADNRPNILLLCVDHWPGRYLQTLGHPTILTPTLDQLAHNGVLFSNAYTTCPSCIPARRELYTGAFSRTHGDRVFSSQMRMPALPTLAQTLRDAGYQAYAVGKMHVYPQRDRVGFDDILLCEEGRRGLGMGADDYELFLADQGYPGQELTHAMGNNEYVTRPWHLPEYCHPTNWTVREMCRTIKRRDPTRPAFWYASFQYPHPPLAPLRDYLEMYSEAEIDMPFIGEWAQDFDALPYMPKKYKKLRSEGVGEREIRKARRAFYALCTHIDHQIRLLIGMLREEGLLENTIIGFTCDHGDMLGNHRMWAKIVFYEDSAKIPFILVPPANDSRMPTGVRDDRLTCLADMMPTLLDLCGVPVPETVEGVSLLTPARREYLYGEHSEGDMATRMIHDGRHKLICYAAGNQTQLFDLQEDPDEMRDLASDPRRAAVRERLTELLVKNLYGSDLEWLRDGRLVGLPAMEYHRTPNRDLSGQRGWRFM